jgi:transcriptional regulator with XRE-family HTH domain
VRAPILTIAAAIRSARRVRGVSQDTLARRLGMKQSIISRIELGQRSVSLLELIALAEALRLDPVELFRRVATASKS